MIKHIQSKQFGGDKSDYVMHIQLPNMECYAFWSKALHSNSNYLIVEKAKCKNGVKFI